MPGVPQERVRAAWLQGSQDVRAATKLVADSAWNPPPPPPLQPSFSPKQPTEVGKVDGVEEANRARIAAMKEKSKKSSIYANRPPPSKIARPATPPAKQSSIDLTVDSPAVLQPIRRKRNKNLILDSDSEETEDSEDERSRKRSKQDSSYEVRALNFFNTKPSDALQELTGRSLCSILVLSNL